MKGYVTFYGRFLVTGVFIFANKTTIVKTDVGLQAWLGSTRRKNLVMLVLLPGVSGKKKIA